jgi:sulfite reductase alpha subunit-like flavoprotein
MSKLLAPLELASDQFCPKQKRWQSSMGGGGGDSYKIFNQAEQEAQKMVGESAAQSAFDCTILVIVGSDSAESAQNGINSMLTSTSVFTNEYCNELDNNQFIEGAFRWIVKPLHWISFI